MDRFFDHVAEVVSRQVARAWFFVLCLASVVIWAPSLPLFDDTEAWQLPINTFTTVVTFLLVALLQNTQDRSTRAVTHKLDAALEALADVLDNTDGLDGEGALAERLRDMVGVEMESSK